MRAAIYVRVSTDEQSTGSQLGACRAFLERKAWAEAAVYDDTGYSGAHTNRPALLRQGARLRRGTGRRCRTTWVG